MHVRNMSAFCYFNPLPLRRGRRRHNSYDADRISFQSTPSSQRETKGSSKSSSKKPVFQSTPSSQRETTYLSFPIIQNIISIHSLFAEGDSRGEETGRPGLYFNPLPLRRGRQQKRTKIPLAHLHITHKTHNNSSKSFFKINFF